MRVRAINAERLMALRGKRTREVIAHELRRRGHGTDAKAIWRYETGRSNPSARVLPDYAEVLGAGSVDELYSDDDEEEHSLVLSSDDLLVALAPLAQLLQKALQA